MKELSRQQSYVAHLDAKQIITIAGPGSGKTHTTIARIVNQVNKGVDPKGIVAITFTNAAAAEIASRLSMQIAHPLGYVGTLHGWCLGLIQLHSGISGYKRGLIVIDNDDAEALLKEKSDLMKYRGSLQRLIDIKSGRLKCGSVHTPEYLVLQAYHRELRASNTIDFDQILEVGLKVIVALKGQVGVSYLFVDEYQDSGEMDAKIYQSIEAQKFFVGDPDQAIYGFRGGDIQGILQAANSPAWQRCDLTENYRSGKRICKVASQLIAHNKNRVAKLINPMRDEEGKVEIAMWTDNGAEIRHIVQDLITHACFNESAILCRTNALADTFVSTLRAMGMQTRSKRDKMPEDWPFVRALALFLLKPDDNRICRRVIDFLEGKAAGTEKSTLAAANGLSINAMWLKFKPALITSAESMIGHIQDAAVKFRSPLTLEGVALMHETLKGREWDSVAEITSALIEVGKQIKEEGTGVTVCTIHSSKGREWDTVYLPGWEQEIFPGKKIGADLEEERRLAFVAITRAKNRILISHVIDRENPYNGKTVECSPSQFIKEINI